jgi:hypothetical protein
LKTERLPSELTDALFLAVAPKSIGAIGVQDEQSDADVQANAMEFMISICGQLESL